MYPEPDQFFDPRLAQGPPGEPPEPNFATSSLELPESSMLNHSFPVDSAGAPLVDEEARLRVEYMERQLASLTGLVHKALAPTSPNPAMQAPGGAMQPAHAGANPVSRPQHLIPTRDTDKGEQT